MTEHGPTQSLVISCQSLRDRYVAPSPPHSPISASLGPPLPVAPCHTAGKRFIRWNSAVGDRPKGVGGGHNAAVLRHRNAAGLERSGRGPRALVGRVRALAGHCAEDRVGCAPWRSRPWCFPA